MHEKAEKTRQGVRSPRAGMTVDHELPDMGAGS